MLEILGPPLRAFGIGVFVVGLGIILLNPPSLAGLTGLIQIAAGAALAAIATAWLTVRMIGDEMPEPEFRRLVDRSEMLASMPPPANPPSEFDELVMRALDELPEEFQRLLDKTPVVVSDRGAEHHAYGHYIGGTMARDGHADRIVIYQDTLERDFGHSPDQLRAQVERTVRHELAHHLGGDERKVQEMGL